MRRILLMLALTLMASCAHQPPSLYQQLGGEPGVARISAHFIAGIPDYPDVRKYFENTDLDRFHRLFAQHLCWATDGGCAYEGDDMIRTHTGMNIDETEFNQVVECLIKAMEANDIPYPVQNRVLARLAPLRPEVIGW